MSQQSEIIPGRYIIPKVLGFSFVLILVFTLVANFLPQVEGEAPVEKEIDLDALTPESFAALGESLFSGKGTCTLCHKPAPLGRAPDIQTENMVALAEQRITDKRYLGDASNAAEYILESMREPSIYVAETWGVLGSDDTVSPMPKADAPPIELSAVEMDAVIAYLQSKDGNEITVALPGKATEVEQEIAAATASAPGPIATGEEVAKKYSCQACHSMLGTSSPVGPSLDNIGARSDRAAIQQSIITPSAILAEGFADIMPKDFADKMTVKELDLIVELLVASTAGGGQ